MGLTYSSDWKFDGIGIPIPTEGVGDFIGLVEKIVAGISDPQSVYEVFKSAFGMTSWSSNVSWAEADLSRAMHSARENAPLFVDAFWSGIIELKSQGEIVPSEKQVNAILDKWSVPLIVRPPELILKGGDVSFAVQAEVDVSAALGVPYTFHEQIGRGGFGVVHRVTRKTAIGEFDFAMKVLEPSAFNMDHERAVARFQKEIDALQRLQHRGIVQHLEAGLTPDSKPYILMPLISGQDVRDALSGADSRKVAAVFDEILNALSHAHAQNVIHRDIKPGNILVRESDGQPIILDFGCAYFLDEMDQATLTTTQIGSLPYIPSEVVRNPKVRSVLQDVYACGILLYEILGESLPDVLDYEPIEAFRNDCPGVDELIRATTAPQSKRLDSAGEFRKRLSKLAREWRRKK